MRISDWSSDVCSSDLALDRAARVAGDPDRQQEVAEIIGGERYLNKPASLIERALSGRLAFAANSEHDAPRPDFRSEEHTSELQSLMRISYAVFCLKKKQHSTINIKHTLL